MPSNVQKLPIGFVFASPTFFFGERGGFKHYEGIGLGVFYTRTLPFAKTRAQSKTHSSNKNSFVGQKLLRRAEMDKSIHRAEVGEIPSNSTK